jgi:acyl CoA:acetate/3-ketoacid CoA transferase
MYNVNNHADTKAGNVEVSTKPGYFDYGCGGFVQITDSMSVNAGLTSKTVAKANTGINLGANFKF